MKINYQEALSFDDIQLVPLYSDILSRQDVDISVYLDEKRNIKLEVPIISSCMDTISEEKMCIAIDKLGGMGILHRFCSVDRQVEMVKNVIKGGCKNFAVAIGVTGDYWERFVRCCNEGCRIFCIDVAHGHHILVENVIAKIRDQSFGNSIHIMAGNVATYSGYEYLSECGVDSVRVGVGNGSICSSREQTGFGVSVFWSLKDCYEYGVEWKEFTMPKLICDGGIKKYGDAVKAYAIGADFVMCGSLFAGLKETPGSIIESSNGKKYKMYRGMASYEAKSWTEQKTKKICAEGISTTVPYIGRTVEDVLNEFEGALRSGLTYCGARNIQELKDKSIGILQSQAAQLESSTHILSRNK